MDREEAMHYFANKAELSDVVDSMTKIGKTANESARMMQVLCDILDVNELVFEEKVTLRNLDELIDSHRLCSQDCTNAVVAARALIERLISERDDARKQYQASREECDGLHEEIVQYRKELSRRECQNRRARNVLMSMGPILGGFEYKRKYTGDDMRHAQIMVYDSYEKDREGVIKILTEETDDQ